MDALRFTGAKDQTRRCFSRRSPPAPLFFKALTAFSRRHHSGPHIELHPRPDLSSAAPSQCPHANP
jgi:hypothetical protein